MPKEDTMRCALSHVCAVLGKGACRMNRCEGCQWEMGEAASTARAALKGPPWRDPLAEAARLVSEIRREFAVADRKWHPSLARTRSSARIIAGMQAKESRVLLADVRRLCKGRGRRPALMAPVVAARMINVLAKIQAKLVWEANRLHAKLRALRYRQDRRFAALEAIVRESPAKGKRPAHRRSVRGKGAKP